jgi:two-component system, sensor histidine kinase and response regulator
MFLLTKLNNFRKFVMNLGVYSELEINTKRKLYIFNQINFLGVITGICVPIAAFSNDGYLPPIAWIVAISPLFISSAVLLSNYYKKYEQAMLIYFTLYPIVTALVYAGNIDVGIELFFILYCVLSVFFIQKITNIILAFSLSSICYLVVYIFIKNYDFKILDINFPFYAANHILAIILIFAGLFLTKKENNDYQNKLLKINTELIESSAKIKEQAQQLEIKTEELTELNTLKDKLFSIISHDLRNPIYSLRNLFNNIYKYDLPASEIKILLPTILSDLNYTTSLMENLLQWSKSQMKGASLHLQMIEVSNLIDEVKNLLRLQAEAKKINLETRQTDEIYIYADKDMMNLVLRNLVSNAIKFTPENGSITIGADYVNDQIDLYVQDTGIGMSEENASKLFKDEFFTTEGTSSEAGSGLGLKLCKEFLEKNNAEISLQSKVGEGTRFTCTFQIS